MNVRVKAALAGPQELKALGEPLFLLLCSSFLCFTDAVLPSGNNSCLISEKQERLFGFMADIECYSSNTSTVTEWCVSCACVGCWPDSRMQSRLLNRSKGAGAGCLCASGRSWMAEEVCQRHGVPAIPTDI